MSDLVREDPPVPRTARLSKKYAAELEKVRAEPGVWFRLISYTTRDCLAVGAVSGSCLARRAPLRRVSEKKAQRDAEWAEISKRILSERRWCEAARPILDALSTWHLNNHEIVVLTNAMNRCAQRTKERAA